ncbi:MAG: hypothetical protein OP8BY_1855 [Candidatus Saccharicenans subterraneus]|uniref:Uncharacterized protein n=1 Tax=Candidatus Saccharicenans subterraneus TaxID=2508984 RepID=A0A3E2BNG2_9BACT|nr:MAG: hypothetical protein OP8BY_1855 [Candidatus Saccharicenans subterraneum]
MKKKTFQNSLKRVSQKTMTRSEGVSFFPGRVMPCLRPVPLFIIKSS